MDDFDETGIWISEDGDVRLELRSGRFHERQNSLQLEYRGNFRVRACSIVFVDDLDGLATTGHFECDGLHLRGTVFRRLH
ncbi:Atu4866 domain-containing protein [Noviherbaspirillum album]|uniref:Atu4866 domain-containing protein n=1 Tax=Noviherbaspirillum album TaxID=3080276 RepID=UPI00345F2F68